MTPPKGGGGFGRYLPSIVVVAAGEPGAGALRSCDGGLSVWATRAAFGLDSAQQQVAREELEATQWSASAGGAAVAAQLKAQAS